MALCCGYRPFPRKTILGLSPKEDAELALAGLRASTRAETVVAARGITGRQSARQTAKREVSQHAMAEHAIAVAEIANAGNAASRATGKSSQRGPTIVGDRGTIRSTHGISDRTTVASIPPQPVRATGRTTAADPEPGRITNRTTANAPEPGRATGRSNLSIAASLSGSLTSTQAAFPSPTNRETGRTTAGGGDPISFIRDTQRTTQGAEAPEPGRTTVQSARPSGRAPTKPEAAASPGPEAEEPKPTSMYKGKGKGKGKALAPEPEDEEPPPVPTGKGNPSPEPEGEELAPAPEKGKGKKGKEPEGGEAAPGKGKKGKGKKGSPQHWFRGPPLPDFLQAKAGNGKNGMGKELGSRFGSQTGKGPLGLLSDELAGNSLVMF